MKELIYPQGATPTAGYAPGVRVGDLLFISGQIARNAAGEIIEGDVAAQADQVFQNIGRVLHAAHLDFQAIVKMNIFALEPLSRLPILEVRDRYCQRGTFASTFVVVKALAAPELLLEIEAVASFTD